MADLNDVEKVTCTNCGAPSTFQKGTLTAEGKAKFRCSRCTSSTLEANVEAHATAGRKLLTED